MFVVGGGRGEGCVRPLGGREQAGGVGYKPELFRLLICVMWVWWGEVVDWWGLFSGEGREVVLGLLNGGGGIQRAGCV